MKRTKLRVAGKATASELKREIQTLLRQVVIARDGGCILRDLRHCGGENKESVWQADHLITRANSATYADSRLVVCVCRGCHLWKKYNKERYDQLVRHLLPRWRIDLWDRCEMDRYHPSHKVASDWKLAIIGLKQEAKRLGITVGKIA